MTLYDVSAVKAKAPDLLSLAEGLVQMDKVSSIQGGEYAGACPFCNDGDDRFRVQPIHQRWLCRYCTDGKWKDVISFIEYRDKIGFKDACKVLFGDGVMVAIDPEELERLQNERFEKAKLIRQEEIESEQEVQNRLHNQREWEPFYKNLKSNPGAVALWMKQGVQHDWIDYYKVGYCNERTFYYHESGERKSFTSPTMTIPTWKNGKCVGLAHRLLIEDANGGKYRPHFAGAGKVLFNAEVDVAGFMPKVLLVEGEKKAMVTFSKIWRSDPVHPHPLYNFSVVGIAGKNFKEEWVSEFDNVSNIWIALDPDATDQSEKIAERLGKDRCFIVELPDKIDDLFLYNALDKDILWQYLKGARK